MALRLRALRKHLTALYYAYEKTSLELCEVLRKSLLAYKATALRLYPCAVFLVYLTTQSV